MASINTAFKALCLFLLFVAVSNSPATELRVFDVRSYGAKGDGTADNANAFTNAWKDACAWEGGSKVYVPKGAFNIGGVKFAGPCNGPTSFVIDGVLLAPTNNADIKKETWMNFAYINDLTISGSGTIDGQGKESWPLNNCNKNANCPRLAMSMGFDFVNNSRIEGITSLNSKAGHFNFYFVDNFTISGVNITAPGDSPNTDGIKLGFSSNINISNTHIATGDDCIAILSGNTNIFIYNVKCGPGHGISVGSLGKNKDEKNVKGLAVRNTVFNGTSDGIRIKTWASSATEIAISNFVYENIQMINVQSPINIDQQYCPYPPCIKTGDSHVQIQNVTLNNIWGTSRNKEAVKFKCSKLFPCKNVQLIDINLSYTGNEESATALCENIEGSATGKMAPPNCLN